MALHGEAERVQLRVGGLLQPFSFLGCGISSASTRSCCVFAHCGNTAFNLVIYVSAFPACKVSVKPIVVMMRVWTAVSLATSLLSAGTLKTTLTDEALLATQAANAPPAEVVGALLVYCASLLAMLLCSATFNGLAWSKPHLHQNMRSKKHEWELAQDRNLC